MVAGGAMLVMLVVVVVVMLVLDYVNGLQANFRFLLLYSEIIVE